MDIQAVKKIAKVSKDEQIRAILGGRTSELVSRLPDANIVIDSLRFADFIDVTADDLNSYVQAYGFPDGYVAEEGGNHRYHGDNQYRIERSEDRWLLFYTERGEKSGLQEFSNLDQARRAIVHELYTSAKITLNHRYWHAHPELGLPSPSEMD
jgi:hypothetical protein